MLELYYWFKGLLIGFIVSAPLGPVGLLCIKRVMNRGLFQGYATGVGAALSDGFYAALAAFGLAFVMNFLIREEHWLRLIGGLFMIGIGIFWLIKKKTYEDFKEAPAKSHHIGEAFSTAFLLNLADPLLLIVYIAIFSGFGLSNASHSFTSALSLVVGVIMGAAAWWFVLVHTVLIFRKKLTAHALFVINRIMAYLVIAFGVFVLVTLVFQIKIFNRTI